MGATALRIEHVSLANGNSKCEITYCTPNGVIVISIDLNRQINNDMINAFVFTSHL